MKQRRSFSRSNLPLIFQKFTLLQAHLIYWITVKKTTKIKFSIRDCRQIQFLILSVFKRINNFYSPWKHQKTTGFRKISGEVKICRCSLIFSTVTLMLTTCFERFMGNYPQIFKTVRFRKNFQSDNSTYESKYSRVDQVKCVEDSL